jgi:SH3 domain protein
MVQMSNGKQGWVLTRFLTSRVPADLVLAKLQKKHARIVEQYEQLKNQASNLNTESRDMAGELATTQKALDKLTREHETLKNESQEFLELKTKYKKAVKDAADARARADKVDKDLQQLISSELNTGLLYGGGLIVLGFITGFIVKRPKRKSPLL